MLRKVSLSSAVLVVSFLGQFTNPLFAQRSLWGRLETGKYKVGLTVKTFSDKTRPEPDSKPRPLEIFLWYPAEKTKTAKSLTFADYYYLSEKKLAAAELPEILAQQVTGDNKGLDTAIAERILGTKMKADRDASPTKGKFPLILWSSRQGTVVSQSVLSEYLASHGYVVAFAGFGGDPLPAPFQIKETETKIATLETHVRDLEFALSQLRRTKNVDADKIGVMTWSYGGESALKLQMKQSDIDLVIGLSSIQFDRGPYQGRFTTEPHHLKVPLVLLWETIGTNGQPQSIPAILNEIPKESYYLSFQQIRHGNFNVLEGLIPGVFGISKVQPWSKGGNVAQIGYEAVCRYSLFYLNYFLKDKREEKLLIEKDFPDNFVKINKFNGTN